MDAQKLEHAADCGETPATDNKVDSSSRKSLGANLKVESRLVETRQRAGSLLGATVISH